MTSSESVIASSLSGENIAQILRADGPTVSCVLLQAQLPESVEKENEPDNGEKSNAAQKNTEQMEENVKTKTDKKDVLNHLIDEIPIDTTPKKSMVSKVLGGQFTFLGQYEEEGIVVMIRRDQNTNPGLEGSSNLVRNPHKLQPPFHNATVYGDILLMRVSDTPEDQHPIQGEENSEEHIDKEEENKTTSNNEAQIEGDGSMKSNDDFFLDYTKEEYITFASRTDILPEESNDEETGGDENEEVDPHQTIEEDSDEEEDDEYNVGSDEDEDSDEEEGRIGMMNLILGQILKRFQEENGRGPDTHELLTMRAALAEKLGIDCIPAFDDESNEQNESIGEGSKSDMPDKELKRDDNNENGNSSKKRKSDHDDKDVEAQKKVKFSNNDQIKIIENVSCIEPQDETDASVC